MDILALLDDNKIAYVPKGSGEYAIICPNQHNHQGGSDSHPSFSINVEKQKGNCLACGFHLGEKGLFRFLSGEDLDEMQVQAIGIRATLRRIAESSVGDLDLGLEDEFTLMPPGKPWDKDYRGIPREFYRQIGAKHCTVGRYANRIIFPIVVNGALCGFESRALGDEKPKYLRSKGFDSLGKGLYPFDLVKAMQPASLILCEGIFDSLNAVSKGFPALNIFGVRTFGLEKFSLLLSTGCTEIISFMDNDKAGNEADLLIAEVVRDWVDISVADKSLLVGGRDLGDLTAEEIDYCLAHRVRI